MVFKKIVFPQGKCWTTVKQLFSTIVVGLYILEIAGVIELDWCFQKAKEGWKISG
jgi:hypothetical protein